MIPQDIHSTLIQAMVKIMKLSNRLDWAAENDGPIMLAEMGSLVRQLQSDMIDLEHELMALYESDEPDSPVQIGV